MIDILFTAWNRREMVEATFAALLEHTDWSEVAALHVHDDGSTDGTSRFLQDAVADVPDSVRVVFESMRLRSPVAVTNRHLDLLPQRDDVGSFVKLDSDFVVCPGWLPELLRQAYLNPGVDIIGLQPRFGPPEPPPFRERTVEPARHIGGIGLMRHRAFEVCRPVPNGYYGFTEWQTRHFEIQKAWVTPDLPCFCLDLIDLEPWVALTTDYIERGWMRSWPKYHDGGRSYYAWWADSRAAKMST